ncbi:hypothetical protein RvVAR0630_06870 [Agrobacterium vitis]|nr:hypothetical protein RvVAR0630_06870 [Agrobacterium vitis]
MTKTQTVTDTKNANRKRTAENAVDKLIPEQKNTEIVPGIPGPTKDVTKTP